jgi:hypothetical protein
MRREGVLRLLEPGEGGGVVGQVADVHLAHAGPRVDHRLEGGLLEVGRALDRGDEVGDEVGAALVLVLDLRPLGVDGLPERDEVVVGAHDHPAHDEGDDDQHTEAPEPFHHGTPPAFGRSVDGPLRRGRRAA